MSERQKYQNKNTYDHNIPSVSQIKNVLEEEYYKKDRATVIRSRIYLGIAVLAIAVFLLASLFPVVRIHSFSMAPAIEDGSIILCKKEKQLEHGDIISFYYQDKIVVRRVIALAGESVEMDSQGRVSVDGQELEESYVEKLDLGNCDLTFPYEVEAGSYFVMADDRVDAIDSRNSLFACVKEENIIGQAFFTIWPWNRIGFIR